MAGKIKFGVVDAFENLDLSMRFGIQSGLPQMVLFKDGAEIDRLHGYVPKSRLQEWLAGKA